MILKGTIIAGHGVASGKGGDPRYPQGTLQLQKPHFQKIGLDLSGYFPGTINIRLEHKTIQVIAPKFRAMNIAWSSHIPPENFFFFDVCAYFEGRTYEGLIYMPDPATKSDHLQDPSVIELLLPEIPGIRNGKSISLEVEDAQIRIH